MKSVCTALASAKHHPVAPECNGGAQSRADPLEPIIAAVAEILACKLGITQPVADTADVIKDLGLDSIQQLTLVVELENHFRICFDPGAEDAVRTLRELAALIHAAKTAAPPADPHDSGRPQERASQGGAPAVDARPARS